MESSFTLFGWEPCLKAAKALIVGHFSTVEKLARGIVPQIFHPEFQMFSVMCEAFQQRQRMGKALEKRTKKLGGISEALPVALVALRWGIETPAVHCPEFSHIFPPAVPAWVGVPFPGIYEKKVNAPAAWKGHMRCTTVLAVEGVK